MTLSLSSSVLPFFRLCVPFFSFSVLGVLSSPEEFQWCFKKVLRVFEVSTVLQGSFNDVSRKFLGCPEKVSRVLTESFKGFSRKF